VDTAGQLLADLQDLPHRAVLPVGSDRACVFQYQVVLVDPLVRRLEDRGEILRLHAETVLFPSGDG
jgi:hypothetical protein